MKVTVDSATLTSIHSLGIGASKDDVTPVITQIALKRDGDRLRAMTTDRYMVLSGLYGKATFEDWADGEEMLIDPKHLKSVVDIVKKDKLSVPIGIYQSDNGTVHAFLSDTSSVFIGGLKASFPPVTRLFPEGEPSGAGALNIRPDFIAKLAKVLPPVDRPRRDRVWRFEFRSIEEQPNRPQPVYAQYSDADTYQLEALIQPALDKR